MKRLATNLSDWLLWFVAGALIVGLAATFEGFRERTDSGAVGTPQVVRTPTRVSYPPPDDIPKPPLPKPEWTRPLPTPPTPASTTARITREQAITKALSHNPTYVDLQARGEITVTAILSTWGEYSRDVYPRYHPTLPIWIVKIETAPWKQWVGPVGQQMQVTYRGWGYVIDSVTGEVLVPGFRIPDYGEKR